MQNTGQLRLDVLRVLSTAGCTLQSGHYVTPVKCRALRRDTSRRRAVLIAPAGSPLVYIPHPFNFLSGRSLVWYSR